MSPYRNLLHEARQKLAEARSTLAARATTLGALRPLLPRRLRKDLDRLEQAIERPVHNHRDIEVAERTLAEYEEWLEVAIAFSDHVARERLATWQRQRSWLCWMMAGAAALGFATVLGVVTSSSSSGSGICILHADGRTHAAASIEYLPTSDADCARSLECKEHGACSLIGGPGGVCRPTMHAHCAHSTACAEHGACNLEGEACVSPTAANPCGLSAECARHGRCATSPDGCYANNDDDCRSSWDCQLNGLCQFVNGRCAAEADEDCAKSRECQLEGHCKAYNGECLSVSDFSTLAAARPKVVPDARLSQ